MSRHAVRLDGQPIGPEIAVFQDMDAKSMPDAYLRSNRVNLPAITQHDDVCHIVIADVAIEIHRPFIFATPEQVAFPRPPKHHISQAEADFLYGSSFFFKLFREELQERGGGALKKQESAGFHVTQPVGMIGMGCFGIDGKTALRKIPIEVRRHISQLGRIRKPVLCVCNHQAVLVPA
ncbi:hypothetical protein ACFFP0_29210 [Rhizobium puerariae]|uniref:Uncharacterized protein n=1 Tax=Rhizobium puerariae TaxID=1585791 RepID=A0ABV6AQP5_9HYPH